ncbi:MAG: KpsF/GutQ family sugar-phosphate isomerase [Niastella sp.]|nr:KpsF/GutQ family sugar-phosphate isomerase [Niastella sp.]
MDANQIISNAIKTIDIEAKSVSGLAAYINEDFAKAVQAIAGCKGRLVISGVGKSAIIAQKIVATLNSTGTPSLFLHAADAIHGDLGMVQQDDIVLLISKSGDTPEIKVLTPLVKNFGNILIGLVGNMQSYLAQQSDIVINCTVEKEACPNNLAPTTSTTVQMVMGDALAICLMENKGFAPKDFARFHPGGALGKKLYLRVGNLVQPHERPWVQPGTAVKKAIIEITEKRLGAAAVINDAEEVIGIITDGDIRRMLEKYESIASLEANDIMGKNPKTIDVDELAAEALEMMRKNNISQLLATRKGKYAGIIHLHDLIREGII